LDLKEEQTARSIDLFFSKPEKLLFLKLFGDKSCYKIELEMEMV